MAEQYAPIAKDESFNTTDLTPKNIADVLQDGLATLASSVKPTADEIPFDNTGTSLVSTDVEGAIKETAGVTYSKSVSNMSINSAVGNLFEGVVGIPTDTSGVGKRVVATFVPTSSFAFAVIRAVTASEVNVSLEKGNSGTVSGTVYVTIYD